MGHLTNVRSRYRHVSLYVSTMGPDTLAGQRGIDRALATDHALLKRRITFKPASRPDSQVRSACEGRWWKSNGA